MTNFTYLRSYFLKLYVLQPKDINYSIKRVKLNLRATLLITLKLTERFNVQTHHQQKTSSATLVTLHSLYTNRNSHETFRLKIFSFSRVSFVLVKIYKVTFRDEFNSCTDWNVLQYVFQFPKAVKESFYFFPSFL